MTRKTGQTLQGDSLLTSHEASTIIGVDTSSVNNWIRSGRLRSFKTPGGHNRIRVRVLCEFLRANDMAIPPVLRDLGRSRLLIVDDDPQELRRWQRNLSARSDDVDFLLVDNGVEALVQVGVFRPHLIVLDVVMPGLDGFEVCTRLRSMPETADVGVVIVSANMTTKMVERASQVGARAAWQKPVQLRDVLELIASPPVDDSAALVR